MTQRGNPNWVKGGASPNPGGRPKVDPAVREALEALTVRAVNELAELLGSEDERIRMDAVREVLNRNLGKPSQCIELGASTDSTIPRIIVEYVKPGDGSKD